MRTTALVTGIVGGVFGIFFGLLALAIGGIGNAVEEGQGNQVIGLGVSAIAAAVAAIICSGLFYAGKYPGLMACGLLIAGIWHLISISYFGIIGGLLILLAALFALLGRNSARGDEVSATVQPSVTAARFCGACGTALPEHGRFCPKCGAAVGQKG